MTKELDPVRKLVAQAYVQGMLDVKKLGDEEKEELEPEKVS